MLTQDDLRILECPFTVNEHEFINGRVYIRERAICRRIEMVDPSWSICEPDITIRDSVVVTKATMIVKGVARGGVGMDKINAANEAEKSAATDVLKRCARLFGVGRYLLDTPGYVKDHHSLAKWLKTLNVDGESTEEDTAPNPAAALNPSPNRRIPAPDNGLPRSDDARPITDPNSPFAKKNGATLEEHFEDQDFATPTTTTTGEKFSDEIDRIVVKETKKGGLFFSAAGCSIFKLDLFAELGYNEYLQQALSRTGTVMLPDPIRIAYLPADDAAKRKYPDPLRVFRPSNQAKVVLKELEEVAA